MKKCLFTGVATALATPFSKDGVNTEEFQKFIQFQISSGVDALVVCGSDAGVVPVKRAYVGEGAAVHLSDVVENSEPLAGDRVCQRADGRDGKKAAYNEHKRQRSAIFFHMVKPPGKLGYNSVSTIISGYIIFCNRNLTIILYS